MHFDCLTLSLEVSVGVAVAVEVEVEAEVESRKAFAKSLHAPSWANSLPAAAPPKQFNKKFCSNPDPSFYRSLFQSLLPQEVTRSTLQLDAAQKLELPPVNETGIHNEFCNYVTCPGAVLAAYCQVSACNYLPHRLLLLQLLIAEACEINAKTAQWGISKPTARFSPTTTTIAICMRSCNSLAACKSNFIFSWQSGCRRGWAEAARN